MLSVRVVNARRVWLNLHWLKPSPDGLWAGVTERALGTVIQKVEQYVMSAALSNPSGVPLIEGKKDERETWSTSYLHLR
jgi:hypothetical protein